MVTGAGSGIGAATHDRGGRYCMSQPDAKIGWNIKRMAPETFTRTMDLLFRAGSHPS